MQINKAQLLALLALIIADVTAAQDAGRPHGMVRRRMAAHPTDVVKRQFFGLGTNASGSSRTSADSGSGASTTDDSGGSFPTASSRSSASSTQDAQTSTSAAPAAAATSTSQAAAATTATTRTSSADNAAATTSTAEAANTRTSANTAAATSTQDAATQDANSATRVVSTTGAGGQTTVVTSVVQETTPTSSAAAATATSDSSDSDSSSSSNRTPLIIGVSVVAGVALLGGLGFFLMRFCGKRSGFNDDDNDIKWPEIKHNDDDGAAMQPLPARRTGGAGFDMGDGSEAGHGGDRNSMVDGVYGAKMSSADSFTGSTAALTGAGAFGGREHPTSMQSYGNAPPYYDQQYNTGPPSPGLDAGYGHGAGGSPYYDGGASGYMDAADPHHQPQHQYQAGNPAHYSYDSHAAQANGYEYQSQANPYR
ncbi:unnamed protein product [Jaminaea pallidilutea]